jgi:hypothetical protein
MPKAHRHHHASRLDGIPALAAFISEDTDAAIFRKFSRLGARNLLHLQSRLNELESMLEQIDEEDVEAAKSNHFIRDAAKAYDTIRDWASQHHDGPVGPNEDARMRQCYRAAFERVQLHQKISAALHEYRMFRLFSPPLAFNRLTPIQARL